MNNFDEPVFERLSDKSWRAREIARGPFDGVQGGAAAGLMCAAVEEVVGQGFDTSSIKVQFLRTVPFEEIVVEAVVLQRGRRMVAADASISANGKLLARSIVTLTSVNDVTVVTEPPKEVVDPLVFERRSAPARHGGPWLMEAMEARVAPDGRYWFRFDGPLTGEESPFARLLAPADWTPGISRPDSWAKPLVRGTPNIDLAVHVDRIPVSSWIGVASVSRWRRRGTGLATARLFDVHGEIGAVASTVVLIP